MVWQATRAAVFGTQPAFAQRDGEKAVAKRQRHLLFAEIALRAYQHKKRRNLAGSVVSRRSSLRHLRNRQ